MENWMRALLIAVVVVGVVASAAHAAPSEFTEARVLEPVTAFLDGSPAKVFCPTSLDVWEQEKADRGFAGQNLTALTDNKSRTIYLHPNGCRILRREIKKPDNKDPFSLEVAFPLALVHESMHTKGIIDEGTAECDAMHLLPRVLVKFFHVKPGRQLRAWMAEAWVVHRLEPAVYQSVC